MSQCAHALQIENLAEANFVEIFGPLIEPLGFVQFLSQAKLKIVKYISSCFCNVNVLENYKCGRKNLGKLGSSISTTHETLSTLELSSCHALTELVCFRCGRENEPRDT